MEYVAYSFTLTPYQEALADVLTYYLGEIGFDSFEPTAEGVVGYLPKALVKEEEIALICENFPCQVAFSEQPFEQKNWNETWEKNWIEPVKISDNIVVIPAQAESKVGEETYAIRISPNCSFGTGTHPTTALLLKALDALPIDNTWEVLDMGCGTGILGIFSLMKGAKDCLALDIDSWSVESTLENAKLNGCSCINVVEGSVEQIEDKKECFHLILANIHRNILLAHIPAYYQSLKKDGYLFLSGFYQEDVEILNRKLTEEGFHHLQSHQQEEWCYIVARK